MPLYVWRILWIGTVSNLQGVKLPGKPDASVFSPSSVTQQSQLTKDTNKTPSKPPSKPPPHRYRGQKAIVTNLGPGIHVYLTFYIRSGAGAEVAPFSTFSLPDDGIVLGKFSDATG